MQRGAERGILANGTIAKILVVNPDWWKYHRQRRGSHQVVQIQHSPESDALIASPRLCVVGALKKTDILPGTVGEGSDAQRCQVSLFQAQGQFAEINFLSQQMAQGGIVEQG